MSELPQHELLGVKVEKLKFLSKTCGLDVNLTAHETQCKVKELTQSTRLSLCHHLVHSESPWASCVSTSTIFVSYSWSYRLKDLIKSVVASCHKDEYVWIDLFCCPQHGLLAPTFHRDSFLEIVQRIGSVTLVLKPTTKPITLTRLWCIFEVFICAHCNGKLDVAMPRRVWKSFLRAAREDIDAFQRAFTSVRAAKCMTTSARDKQKITDSLKEAGGFSVVDQVVMRAMQQWLMALLERESAKSQDEEEKAGYLHSLGSVHLSNQELGQAQECFNNAWHARKLVLGSDHRQTLSSMYSLATVYTHQQKLSAAKEMLETCLKLQRHALGEHDPHTLATMNGLAAAMERKKEDAAAEAMWGDCLARKQTVMGRASPSVVTTMGNLAVLYSRQKRFGEAEALYKEIVRLQTERNGAQHPDALLGLHHLALCHRNQGRSGRALGVLEACLHTAEASLGPEHPLTMDTLHELGLLHSMLGDSARAAEVLERCWRRRRRALGAGAAQTRETEECWVAVRYGRRCTPCAPAHCTIT